MSLISSCPQCAKQVSIPLGVDPQAKVRCPICQGEFALNESLELAPPLLELVESPDSLGIDVSDVASEELSQTPAAMAALGSPFAAGLTEHSLSETEPMFSEDISFDAPPASDSEADGTEEFDTELENVKSPASLDDLMGESLESGGELDQSEAPGEESPFGFDDSMTASDDASMDDAGEATGAGLPPIVSGARRRKKEPSALGTLIGVVGGGMLAVPLSLFIVLWIGGPDKDFLNVAQYIPKILLPPSFSKPRPVAPATPPASMASQPTQNDLAVVKKAADDAGFGNLKLNVPELPDKPATDDLATDSAASDESEESATDPAAKSDDLASDSTTDDDAFSSDADKPDTASIGEPSDDASADSGEEPQDTDTAATDEMPADETAAADEVPEDADNASEVGPIQPVTYSLADLAAVVDDLRKLNSQMADAATLDKDAAKKLKNQFYRKFYRLGEVVTFAADDEDSPGLGEQQSAIETVLAEFGGDKAKFNEIGAAGGKWLSLPADKWGEDKGVMLAGTVDEVTDAGPMHRVRLMLAGKNEPVNIYSAKEPGVAVGDSVIVLGSIVTDPKNSLHNFTDDEATVVWQGLAVKTSAN